MDTTPSQTLAKGAHPPSAATMREGIDHEHQEQDERSARDHREE